MENQMMWGHQCFCAECGQLPSEGIDNGEENAIYTMTTDPGACPYLKIRHSSKSCLCRLYETNSILSSLVLIIIWGFPGGSDGK